MKGKVDAGDILARDNFPISSDETGRSLLSTCFRSGALLFKKLLTDFVENRLTPAHQDLAQRSYYYNRVPHGGLVDFSWDTAKICRFVRALTFSPFPNPLSPPMLSFGNAKFVITKAVPSADIEANPKQRPGSVIRIEETGVLVSSGDGSVIVRLSDNSGSQFAQAAFCQLKGISAGSIFETPPTVQ
jgi:methionyl-tRNA formyltransferase